MSDQLARDYDGAKKALERAREAYDQDSGAEENFEAAVTYEKAKAKFETLRIAYEAAVKAAAEK